MNITYDYSGQPINFWRFQGGIGNYPAPYGDALLEDKSISHVTNVTPQSVQASEMEALSLGYDENKLSLDLGVLYQMYDNPDTRENAMELYTVLEQTLPTIMDLWNQYHGSNMPEEKEKLKQRYQQSVELLETEYLNGHYNIAPMQTFYLDSNRLPFLYDSTASQIDNASNRIDDLDGYIGSVKTSLHGDVESINTSLSELNASLGSDDSWYSDDEAYDRFKNRMAGADVDSWYQNMSYALKTQQYIYINDPTLVKYLSENIEPANLGQSGASIITEKDINRVSYPKEKPRVKYFSADDMSGVYHDNKEGKTNVYMYPDYPWDSSFIPRTVDLTQLDENGHPIRTDDLVEYDNHLSTPGILVNKDIFMGVGEDGKKTGVSGDSATANFPRYFKVSDIMTEEDMEKYGFAEDYQFSLVALPDPKDTDPGYGAGYSRGENQMAFVPHGLMNPDTEEGALLISQMQQARRQIRHPKYKMGSLSFRPNEWTDYFEASNWHFESGGTFAPGSTAGQLHPDLIFPSDSKLEELNKELITYYKSKHGNTKMTELMNLSEEYITGVYGAKNKVDNINALMQILEDQQEIVKGQENPYDNISTTNVRK